jgi:hypothetical protein
LIQIARIPSPSDSDADGMKVCGADSDPTPLVCSIDSTAKSRPIKPDGKGSADEARVGAVEHRASRLVGYTLYFLVAYVVFNSAYGIFIAHRVTDTHESAWGILIGLVAKIGMPILAGYKLKVAARLNSRALRADAIEAIVCGYLSIVLMVGLAATRILDGGGSTAWQRWR